MRIANFLNKPVTEEQLDKLNEYLQSQLPSSSFQKKMDASGTLSNNKRTVGNWKDQFSPELNSQIDEWIEKNLEGTDLKFVIE